MSREQAMAKLAMLYEEALSSYVVPCLGEEEDERTRERIDELAEALEALGGRKVNAGLQEQLEGLRERLLEQIDQLHEVVEREAVALIEGVEDIGQVLSREEQGLEAIIEAREAHFRESAGRLFAKQYLRLHPTETHGRFKVEALEVEPQNIYEALFTQAAFDGLAEGLKTTVIDAFDTVGRRKLSIGAFGEALDGLRQAVLGQLVAMVDAVKLTELATLQMAMHASFVFKDLLDGSEVGADPEDPPPPEEPSAAMQLAWAEATEHLYAPAQFDRVFYWARKGLEMKLELLQEVLQRFAEQLPELRDQRTQMLYQLRTEALATLDAIGEEASEA